MPYQVTLVPSASRVVDKLSIQLRGRIAESLAKLADNPRGHGSVKLTGQDAYRIRVGDYRILYTIQDQQLLVLVIDVGHRREVYRRK